MINATGDGKLAFGTAPESLHALPINAVCVGLETSLKGLTSDEARERLSRFGRNVLPRTEPPGLIRVFFRQFLNPLIYILLAAALISAAMRDWPDGGFILAVLIINALIGSFQEYRAERSSLALHALTAPKAYAIRDGQDHEVDAADLVPGDVILLEAGNKVPADVRLISNGGIETDESLLTGESTPVSKRPLAELAENTPLADRVNMAYAATLVTRGRAYGIVVATGLATQIGRIASSLTAPITTKPPLLARMERFTKRIALAVAGTVMLLGAVLLFRGGSVVEVLMLAIALAVSAIPEGLPVALTVALSIGARRMAQRRVIARRMVAVEALGSCTFIASDKTGTLTLNQLAARRVILATGSAFEFAGPRLPPEGKVLGPDSDRPILARLAAACVLCNNGLLELRDNGWVHHGDAVDVALLAMAFRAGVNRADVEAEHPRVAEIPFEPEQRFAATLHRSGGLLQAVVKGAVEQVIPMCTRMATLNGDVAADPAILEKLAVSVAKRGYRVLAVAAGPIMLRGKEPSGFRPDVLKELVFLGFIGMIDPLRPEAKASVLACQTAGIQVAMVTGDHPATALAIAHELGFAYRPEQVVTGSKFAKAAAQGSRGVDRLVRKTRVFARVEPGQKLEIVKSLIRIGHIVAVTGDGVNDAPALRAAHIGIAMGARGSEMAVESAALILTDDNFASIVAGVEEGRIAYGNVRKVIYLLVASGGAELLLFALTTAVGLPLPLWPVQLLWLNLVTNGIQDVALAFEPGEGGELNQPPRPPREPIFNRLMIERTLVSALLIGLATFFAFKFMIDQGWPIQRAQNGALLLLVLFENVQAMNSRSETASLFSLSPLRNPLLLIGVVAAQCIHIAAIYTPGLREVLHLEHVSLIQWLGSLSLVLTLLVVSEAHKLLIRRRMRNKPAQIMSL